VPAILGQAVLGGVRAAGTRNFWSRCSEVKRRMVVEVVKPPSPGAHSADDAALRALMIRYQGGDAMAAEQLIEILSPRLFRYLCPTGCPPAHAEDILQDCWLRVHKARHSYRPEAPVLPWLYAIARHTGLDAYRRQRRIDSRETPLEDQPQPVSEPSFDGQFGDDGLRRALNALPKAQREVVWMLKVSGMSLEEVARATASTTGAVKQKAHRAYRKLRQLLGGTAT